jgi:hypothetical protein
MWNQMMQDRMFKLDKARDFSFLLGLCFILFTLTVFQAVILVARLLAGA